MILVTGGSGFIGSKLVHSLIKRGYDVKILTRDPRKIKIKDVESVKGDITRKETLKNAVKDVDVVVHLAGLVSYTKPEKVLYRINVDGTKNLLDVSKNVDKFIFSSSVSVFGPIKGVADENYPCKPMSYYGKSKLEAENLIHDSGIKHVILRIAPVYGAGSPYWLKNLKMLDSGFPIPNTKSLTHIVHISDVVNAFILSMKKGEGIYNIADKKPIPFVRLAEKTVKLLGKKPKKLPLWLVYLISVFMGKKKYIDVLTMNRNYSIKKAQKELGYKPKADMDKELKKMIDWYKSLRDKHVQYS